MFHSCSWYFFFKFTKNENKYEQFLSLYKMQMQWNALEKEVATSYLQGLYKNMFLLRIP